MSKARKEAVSGQPAKEEAIPAHRRCPCCHTGPLKGKGIAYSTQGRKRYYKCDACGHTWSVTLGPQIVIETSRGDVNLDERGA